MKMKRCGSEENKIENAYATVNRHIEFNTGGVQTREIFDIRGKDFNQSSLTRLAELENN
jgi:hypothetical protein